MTKCCVPVASYLGRRETRWNPAVKVTRACSCETSVPVHGAVLRIMSQRSAMRGVVTNIEVMFDSAVSNYKIFR